MSWEEKLDRPIANLPPLMQARSVCPHLIMKFQRLAYDQSGSFVTLSTGRHHCSLPCQYKYAKHISYLLTWMDQTCYSILAIKNHQEHTSLTHTIPDLGWIRWPLQKSHELSHEKCIKWGTFIMKLFALFWIPCEVHEVGQQWNQMAQWEEKDVEVIGLKNSVGVKIQDFELVKIIEEHIQNFGCWCTCMDCSTWKG